MRTREADPAGAPRRFPRWPALLLLQFAAATTAAVQAPTPKLGLPLLTRLEQIRNLTLEKANLGYPVRVRGVVTYFDPATLDLFVQDSTAGIWVDARNAKLSLKPGQLIELEGVSSAPDFAPQVSNPRVRILGRAPMPIAREVSFERMVSSSEDSQWVEVQGVVRWATEQPSGSYAKQPWEPEVKVLRPAPEPEMRLTLEIAVEHGRLKAHILDYQKAKGHQLVDARVRLRGVCGSIFNRKGQLTGIQLFVPSLAQVRVEEPAPLDAFSVPVRSTSSLLRFAPEGASGHRARVQGVVTLERGRSLFIEDASGSVLVQMAEATPVRPGDRLDVLGFPAADELTPVVQDAVFRKLASGPPPVPKPISWSEPLQGQHDAELVQIDARLLDRVPGGVDQVLVLQAGNAVFSAHLEPAKTAKQLATVVPGSLLRLTGVCSVEVDEARQPRTFRLLLRSPEDVEVLERPPWWTLKYALGGLGAMAAIILAALAWAEALRRKVRGQTSAIREFLRREAALKREYLELFENASDLVFTRDLAGKFTSLNKTGERVTGYSRKEFCRMNIIDLVTPEYRETMRERVQRLAADGQEKPLEIEIVTKDGRKVMLEVTARNINDGDKPVGVQGIGRDITERKRAAEELQQAKDAAEQASRAKSEFLAIMSHEIRTPMNGIVGMAGLALDTELSSEQREYLDIVKASADGLLTLINDILDFSKIEAGKLELDPIELDLPSTLGSIMKTLAVRAHEKGLELAYSVDPEVPKLLVGDPGRLRQILVNLVGNAIKFTEHGEVIVEVRTESRTQDRIVLHFAVADTGIGIPRQKQQDIFQAFTQSDTSTSRKYGGTGLGLTISARLVEMMGGRIWVKSEPDQGSVFHFTASLQVPQQPEAAAFLPEPVSLEGKPALVADDNATNRRILAEMLSNWLMKPALADGGWTALAAMQKARDGGRPYPLVLIDAQMPDMDGFALVERIKQDPSLAGAAIIMLTSAGQRGDAVRCRKLGVSAYLIKPVKQSELLKAIVTVLSKSAAPRKPPELVTRHFLREKRRPLRILLAEDNAVNQKLAQRLLEKQGHTVTVAGDGRQALAALEKMEGFDLVLMDVQMPEMDGFKATALIREREEKTGQHLPIVAMTAHAMTGDRERCLQAGMDGYVSKPVDADELFTVIESSVPPSAPAERPAAPLDWSEALARVEGDKSLLADLVKLFFEDCPRLLRALRQAAEQRDAKRLEEAAHALKSSLGNFAAHDAAEAAARLEGMGCQSDLAEAQEACRALEAEIERLRPVLEGLGREVAP